MKEGKPRDSDENNPRLNLEEIMPQARIELEGATLPFTEVRDGRTTLVTISEIREILGKGNFAEWVASVDVHLADEENTDRKINMVLKRFKENEFENGEENMNKSVEMFQKVRAADVPTWTTYRPSIGNRTVLMTSGLAAGKTFVTYNDPGEIINNRTDLRIEELDIESISSQLDSICARAARANIFLTPDSFGYLINNHSIDVIVSDFDMLDEYSGFGFTSVYERNVLAAKKSIGGLFRILDDELKIPLLQHIEAGLGKIEN